MSNTSKAVIGLLLGACAVLLIISGGKNSNLGSVNRGNEYLSTTTSALGFSGLQVTLVSNSAATLGSVVVASSSPAGTLLIKNATSTSDISSTTLASFPLAAVAGTYTFDSSAPRGIIIETSTTFTGAYTITYRNN